MENKRRKVKRRGKNQVHYHVFGFGSDMKIATTGCLSPMILSSLHEERSEMLKSGTMGIIVFGENHLTNLTMASFTSRLAFSHFPHKPPNIRNSRKLLASANSKRFRCFNSSAPQWEPAPISYALGHQDTLIFETLNSPNEPPETSIATKTEHLTSKNLH
ncbi:RING finger protein 151 [Striga asiatica]|uniref:RING finger protein 151 n=1 Tax=Striga asiatica TaxID=4170 RepID=A0A5A7QN85_STRAF|nr:RING finger protein 151 [Striga asiatica]